MAAKGIPDLAESGLVRAKPLFMEFFDKNTSDKVFISIPTVIQLVTLQTPKLVGFGLYAFAVRIRHYSITAPLLHPT